MIEEMHTRKEQPFSPVHSPQLKVFPGHFKVRIGFRLMNGMREVLQRTLQGCQQFYTFHRFLPETILAAVVDIGRLQSLLENHTNSLLIDCHEKHHMLYYLSY